MADNVTAPVSTGTFATDEINAVHYPRTKLCIGADGSAIDVSDTAPIPVNSGYLPAGTNRSGSITTGGTAQVLAAANTTRRGLFGQNISNGDLWINEIGGTAASGSAGSYRVAAGESFSISTNRAISILGGATGQAWTAVEV